jgi:catechol 2,3-dioxygenase-like lactoylglutathione lyase family enzyme
VNLQSGGGFEIWQYTERTPVAASFEILAGDLGIYAVKIKAKDVRATWESFMSKKLDVGPLVKDPAGKDVFFIQDPYKNLFQVVGGDGWFREEKKLTGAAYGAVIGVSDIERALKLYTDILGYDRVLYDVEGSFDDLNQLPGGKNTFRRVLLRSSEKWMGSFSRLFGPSVIELIQVKDRTPRRIFENRFWGDLGFIHLCYDINGMETLKKECEEKGFPFTVDSAASHDGNSFDMGEAAGHFSYIEDPDGTLIEFVETHKVPIMKKFGFYLNLNKRDPHKSLPDWIVKAMRFSRVKD